MTNMEGVNNTSLYICERLPLLHPHWTILAWKLHNEYQNFLQVRYTFTLIENPFLRLCQNTFECGLSQKFKREQKLS